MPWEASMTAGEGTIWVDPEDGGGVTPPVLPVLRDPPDELAGVPPGSEGDGFAFAGAWLKLPRDKGLVRGLSKGLNWLSAERRAVICSPRPS